MRGEDVFQESLFTTVQLESFVPSDHPLRAIKALLGEAMKNLNWLFGSIYAVWVVQCGTFPGHPQHLRDTQVFEPGNIAHPQYAMPVGLLVVLTRLSADLKY